MCVSMLVLRADREPSWFAGEQAIRELSEQELNQIADEYGCESSAEARERLYQALESAQNAIEHWNRECTSFRFGDTLWYLTGGLSTGDPPTDLFDDFELLHATRIAETIGFYWPPNEPMPESRE
jgi:hypothetical protein